MKFPRQICEEAVDSFKSKYPDLSEIPAGLDTPPEPEMGDLSVALPMRAAGRLGRSPRDIAGELADFIAAGVSSIETVEVAGPGFVNCTFSDAFIISEVRRALEEKELEFPGPGSDHSVLLEFVSANPTGPLHVGHGRGAVYGDVLGRLFEAFGYSVQREYYVNDGGTQVRKLGESLQLRAREMEGEEVTFSDGHYRGDYVGRLVREQQLTADQPAMELAEIGKEKILSWIFSTLEQCRINFDNRVYESEVAGDSELEQLVEDLDSQGLTYEQDGALFLETSRLGDDKDRVLLRSNGEPTYFANDLVYHLDKYRRDFDSYIDVWGHDHHGYQQRLRSGLQASGRDLERFEIELYQLVDLYRDGEPLAMSTREGEFVSLEELLDEVGTDAVRFNFLTKNHTSPLDFDIEVATSQTEENPVYYVQYAHTRLAGILRNAGADFEQYRPAEELTGDGHRLLFRALNFIPFLEQTLAGREPHRVTFWLRELARQFHTYYTSHQVVDPDNPRVSALRLELVRFLKLVFKTGLELLEVSAPERM